MSVSSPFQEPCLDKECGVSQGGRSPEDVQEGEGKREKEGYEKKGTKKLKEDKTYEQEWAGTTNISWIKKK